MNKVKVSVVIPAYNVESYIENALNSIIRQTLKEIEIIIIDDGSTDRTLEILQKFASGDKRIIIIPTANNGQSIARNIGFYQAEGEYIYFFDSDDLLEDTALEKCYFKCSAGDLDFCFFDADVFSEDNLDFKNYDYRRSYLYEDVVYRGIDLLKRQLKKGYSCSPCLCFIKREFLVKENLFFYPRIIHEDELFTFMLYLKSNRVACINEVFFHRRLRPGSTMTSLFSERNMNGYLHVCMELYKNTLIYQCKKEYSFIIKSRISVLLVSCFISANNYLSNELVKYYKRKIIYEFKNCLGMREYLIIKFFPVYRLLRQLKTMARDCFKLL